MVRPSCMAGSKGLPVAINTAAPVQAMRSSGTASLLLVGFDIGMITGREVRDAINRTWSRWKAPAWPGVRSDPWPKSIWIICEV